MDGLTHEIRAAPRRASPASTTPPAIMLIDSGRSTPTHRRINELVRIQFAVPQKSFGGQLMDQLDAAGTNLATGWLWHGYLACGRRALLGFVDIILELHRFGLLQSDERRRPLIGLSRHAETPGAP